jgi:hypothetical protein
VQEYCDYVYILSVLTTIPTGITHLVPQSDFINPETLYNVSLSDLSWLDGTWPNSCIAMTRDEILLDKHIFDATAFTNERDFTQIRLGNRKIQATQRDYRRFQLLVDTLKLNTRPSIPQSNALVRSKVAKGLGVIIDTINSLVFSQYAIYGFLWWASAGEHSNIEADADAEGLPIDQDMPTRGVRLVGTDDYDNEVNQPLLKSDGDEPPGGEMIEVTIVGYFHQMARRLFTTASSIIESQDCYAQDGFDEAVELELSDIQQMGLDVFSAQDCEFAVNFIKVWWNREARINKPISLCCG